MSSISSSDDEGEQLDMSKYKDYKEDLKKTGAEARQRGVDAVPKRKATPATAPTFGTSNASDQPTIPAGITLSPVPEHYGAGTIIHIGQPGTQVLNEAFFSDRTIGYLKRREKRGKSHEYSVRRYAYTRNAATLELCLASIAADRRQHEGWVDTDGPCDECEHLKRDCLLMLDDVTAFWKGTGTGKKVVDAEMANEDDLD